MAKYNFTDNPTKSGVAVCNTDILNDCIMHLKYCNGIGISNCLTEIPQRAKIELNNGVLTLKAGSEMVIPNGFESDGTTKKFTYYKIASDISQKATFNAKHYTFPQQGGANFAHFVISNTYVQGTKPTVTSTTACWYDTSANRFKITSNTGATWNEVNYGLPIAITTSSTTGYTSIDAEFNGFGYLKNLFWVEKGIKGLIPNGRNEDGSLNNIEFTTNNTLIETVSTNYSTSFPITIRANNFTVRNPAITYDEKANYNRAIEGQPFYECLAVEALFSDGAFQWIKPKTTFRAVDYNDKSEISSWGFPSSRYIDLELGASGTIYTAPANGYVQLTKHASTENQMIMLGVMLNDKTDSSIVANREYCTVALNVNHTNNLHAVMPVVKNARFFTRYTADGNTQIFRFIYAEGER